MRLGFAAIAALAGSAAAHMALTYPCPRYSPHCATKPRLPAGVADYDYSLKTPLSSSNGGSKPLCKYTKAWPQPVASWTAGQSVTVTFQKDGAGHGGGHCQFSMSYDGGKTFVVIHEELEHCFFNGPSTSNQPQVFQYTFNLPQALPASNSAIFSWSWVNAMGNREFYMNCADVTISGTSKSFTGKKMTILNFPGYPALPEFGGNYKTGLQYYTNQPSITVTGNGGSAPAPNSDYIMITPSQYVPTNVQNQAASPGPLEPPPYLPAKFVYSVSSSTPSSSDSSSDTTLATDLPAGAACTHGVYQCTTNGKGFQICVFGQWTSMISCGTGTQCKATVLGSVYCGW